MKDSKILIIIAIILSILLIVDIASRFTKIETPIPTENVLPECVEITEVTWNTNDAVKLHISCKWYIDVATTETDRFKVDLIVSRTIKKYFNNISYEYLLEHKLEVLDDLQERIKDCVFALQPYGFNITTLFIRKAEG
jgi:hypothetical protein